MIIVHLCRKSCGGTVAQNVLEHGTGALNVEGCRIRTSDNLNSGGYAERTNRQGLSGDRSGAINGGMFQPGHTAGLPFCQPVGRWPANLLLSHSPGCLRSGSKRVKGSGFETRTSITRKGGIHADAKGHQSPGRSQTMTGYSDPDGTESTEAWECMPGCIVRVIDGAGEAMGSHLAGNKKPIARNNAGFFASGRHTPSGSGRQGAIFTEGMSAVSRFFKQLKP